MTDWKYSVYLTDLYDEFDDEEEENVQSIKNVVNGIYERLLLLKEQILKKEEDPEVLLSGLSGLDYIIDDFHYFDECSTYGDTIDEFERIMGDLYDFADYNFVWINTFDRSIDGIGKPKGE
jgi:hypothetical protein